MQNEYEILREIQSYGFDLRELKATNPNEVIRFGKDKSCWYVAYADSEGFCYAKVEDFRGITKTFEWKRKSNFKEFTEQEKTDFARQRAEQKAIYQKELEEKGSKGHENAKKFFEKSRVGGAYPLKIEGGRGRGLPPYLEKKKLTELILGGRPPEKEGVGPPTEGVGVVATKEGSLIIPFYDIDGKIQTTQTILLQKIDFHGSPTDKFWQSGCIKKGGMLVLGDHFCAAKMVYIAEGFATAYTVYALTGITTVMCGDSGNIKPVVDAIKGKYPNIDITICADNDCWSESNAGIKSAQRAGCKFIYPAFKQEHHHLKPTDFNDLYCLEGEEECKRQLKGGDNLSPPFDNSNNLSNEENEDDKRRGKRAKQIDNYGQFNSCANSINNNIDNILKTSTLSQIFTQEVAKLSKETRQHLKEANRDWVEWLTEYIEGKQLTTVSDHNSTALELIKIFKYNDLVQIGSKQYAYYRKKHFANSLSNMAQQYKNTKLSYKTKNSRGDSINKVVNLYDLWNEFSGKRLLTTPITFDVNKDFNSELLGTQINSFKNQKRITITKYNESNVGHHLFRELIMNLVNHDKNGFDYVIQWVKNIIIGLATKTYKRNETMLIFQSNEEGVGKNTFTNLLRKILDVYSCETADSNEVFAKFNSIVEDRLLVIIDEADITKDSQEKIKSFITSKTVNIEKKGIDKYEKPNLANIIVTTNNEFAIRASKSARRFTVFKIKENKQHDKNYFNNIYQTMEDSKSIQQFINYLAQFQGVYAAEFVRRNPYKNEDLEDQINKNNPELKAIEDLEKFAKGFNKKAFTFKALQDYILQESNSKLTPHRISGALNKAGFVKKQIRIIETLYSGGTPKDSAFNTDINAKTINYPHYVYYKQTDGEPTKDDVLHFEIKNGEAYLPKYFDWKEPQIKQAEIYDDVSF